MELDGEGLDRLDGRVVGTPPRDLDLRGALLPGRDVEVGGGEVGVEREGARCLEVLRPHGRNLSGTDGRLSTRVSPRRRMGRSGATSGRRSVPEECDGQHARSSRSAPGEALEPVARPPCGGRSRLERPCEGADDPGVGGDALARGGRLDLALEGLREPQRDAGAEIVSRGRAARRPRRGSSTNTRSGSRPASRTSTCPLGSWPLSERAAWPSTSSSRRRSDGSTASTSRRPASPTSSPPRAAAVARSRWMASTWIVISMCPV